MKKKLKTKEPDFGDFAPKQECNSCKGRGEVKDEYISRFLGSSNWTYKKCVNCNGTGKNLWSCLTCKSLLNNSSWNFVWCSNKNCEKFNLAVVLANKKEK